MPLEPKQLAPYYQTSNTGYKLYAAKLTQTGTNAPIPTIVQNTLGNIVWTRDSMGTYIATLIGAFPNNKVIAIAGLTQYIIVNIGAYRNDDDTYYIETGASGAKADDCLTEQYIELRVYN